MYDQQMFDPNYDEREMLERSARGEVYTGDEELDASLEVYNESSAEHAAKIEGVNFAQEVEEAAQPDEESPSE